MSIIVETCPVCGSDLIHLCLTTYPPINKTECPKCGWSITEHETIERVPYNRGESVNDSTKEIHYKSTTTGTGSDFINDINNSIKEVPYESTTTGSDFIDDFNEKYSKTAPVNIPYNPESNTVPPSFDPDSFFDANDAKDAISEEISLIRNLAITNYFTSEELNYLEKIMELIYKDDYIKDKIDLPVDKFFDIYQKIKHMRKEK